MLEDYQDDIAYNEWIDSQIAKSEVTYTPNRTLLVAKGILQINAKVAKHGASYTQQYMLPQDSRSGATKAQTQRRRNSTSYIDATASRQSTPRACHHQKERRLKKL